MERLTPAERASFLLHDVFSYDFKEIASILGKTETACRKLASRARNAVRRNQPASQANSELHQQLVEAFFEALNTGDIHVLKALLADSTKLHSDSGGRVTTAPGILKGRDSVAEFFQGIWQAQVPTRDSISIVTRWFNGSPGALIYQHQQLQTALNFSIAADNAIIGIYALRNPDKLSVFQS